MMDRVVPMVISLNNLSEGETGEIILVRGKPDFHRYLHGMGLTMGRTVSVNPSDNASPDSSLIVQSGNMVSTIGKDIAHNIKVRVA
jgi:Fe2+ transport system protein FeoA